MVFQNGQQYTTKVLLQMYDVINFVVISCCDYCIWRDVQFATKLLEHARQNSIESNIQSNLFNKTTTTDEATTSKDQHNRIKQETMLLMDIYKSKEKDFHSGKTTVKHRWETVSKEMEKMEYNISGQKCCIKFQAMKRTYKSIKDHNKKSGNNAKKWEYFDLMDNILKKPWIGGEKPWIEPLSVAGTNCDADSESTSTKEIRKQSAKKRKASMDKYFEELLEEKRVKREADENKHKEMMKQYESLNTLLQKFIEKDGA